MAAGSWNFYNDYKLKLVKAQVDMDTNVIKCLMTTSSYTPNVATQGVVGDITNEVTDGDYARVTCTVSVSESGGTTTVDAADISFGSAVTITAKYAILYDDTATDALIAYVDLDTGGGSVSSTSSTFQITINAAGVFTLTG